MIPRVIALTGVLGAAFATAASAADGVASGDTSKAKIALSNSYAGNTWRQQMLKTWDAATKDAQGKKLIADSKVVNSNNSAPEQANQIENMIVEGWNAIVINAASPTALNGVIQEACDAEDRGGRLRRPRHGTLRLQGRLRLREDGRAGGRLRRQEAGRQGQRPGDPRHRRRLGRRRHQQGHPRHLRQGHRHQAGRLGPRQLDPDRGAEGGRERPADPAQGRRDRRPGRRRLGRLPGVQVGRPADPAHHHGQPAGRAGPVGPAAAAAGRLRHVLAVLRTRRGLDRVLGGAAGPGRQAGAEHRPGPAARHRREGPADVAEGHAPGRGGDAGLHPGLDRAS